MFKTAEKLYGVKPNNIGEMRNAVVPYTIALLGYLINYELDLYKIWKSQRLSDNLQSILYDLMKQVNKFIIEKSPSSHYIEWAKKEDCWNMIKEHKWKFNTQDLKSDIVDTNNLSKRSVVTESEKDILIKNEHLSILNSIPYKVWKNIESWSIGAGVFSINQRSTILDVSSKLKNKKNLTDAEISRAINIFEIVCNKNIDILYQSDDNVLEVVDNLISSENERNISLELVRKMVDWDKRNKKLKDWQWVTMRDIIDGKYPLEGKYLDGCLRNLETLKSFGFSE